MTRVAIFFAGLLNGKAGYHQTELDLWFQLQWSVFRGWTAWQ